MSIDELRKLLEQGIKRDVSGKTTPLERMTPFYKALVDYLEETQPIDKHLENMFQKLEESESNNGVTFPPDGAPFPMGTAEQAGTTRRQIEKVLDRTFDKVSSDDATPVAPANQKAKAPKLRKATEPSGAETQEI